MEIEEEVDPFLEIAEIHRRVAAANGPALFFKKVKGSSFPVVTNLFGSKKRLEIAFPARPEKVVEEAALFLTRDFPPTLNTLWKKRSLLKKFFQVGLKQVQKAPVTKETATDLFALPLLTSWPEDGGPFITLPLVYTESPLSGASNLGMYRAQRHGAQELGLHWQIAKGGGFHYQEAESLGKPLPVTFFIGGPPALILSAIAPLPENIPELLLASLLQGKKLKVTKENLIAECEFALVGEARPFERKLEGPFGDHYGYYSLAHEFPLFHCKKILHRKGAIYPATVVGKPLQEDFYIGNYLQELLSPLFPIVMPGVRALWSYGETGFHSLTAAVVKERYFRECMTSCFRILGEGQLSLTKFLLATDQPVDVKDIKAVLSCILERFQPERDLFIFANLSLDTLDYTGPTLNQGSRGILIGLGDPIRTLPEEYRGPYKARPFCRGCLVIESQEALLPLDAFSNWPLLIVVDDLEKTLRSTNAFLWTVFTRFEPAADIQAGHVSIYRNHLCRKGPILIDARMKEKYPKELLCDPSTHALVTQKWKKYFPQGMEMGDSLTAHVV